MIPHSPIHRRPPRSSENDPPINIRQRVKPTISSRIRNCVQDTSRRRRVRTAGERRYVVAQAKQHRDRIRSISNIVRLHVAAPPRTPPDKPILVDQRDSETKNPSPALAPLPLASPPLQITMIPISLPRCLARPNYREISKDVLAAIEPDLKHTNLDYILEGLEHLGPQMLHVLTSVQADPVRNTLPKELGVLVNDLSSDPPTHMLALYSRDPPGNTTTRRSVTLFPTHNIILAAHCAHLPKLPTAATALYLDNTKGKITIPTVPLCIPSPQTFPHLSAYLYTKNPISLLTSLFSTRPPLSLNLNDGRAIHAFAGRLAGTYTTHALLRQVMMVNGIWRNACALGVFDDGLWGVLDIAWETLLTALAIATGNPQAVLSDA